jgi:hypothetical protein
MPWVNLDDQYPEHPKVDSLSDGAFRLNTAAICYCNRQKTDGIVAASMVPRLMPKFRPSYVQELLDRMLWHDIGGGSAYELHDYLDWNRSREQIEAAVAKNSANGRKGAEKRWGTK